MSIPTEVIYNSVSLSLIRTAEYRQEPEYDQLTGKDYLWTHFTFRFEGIVSNLTNGDSLPPSEVAEPPQTTINRIRLALETPRAPFVYTIGGTTVLESPPAGYDAEDDNHGPITRHVNVIAITPQTFGVSFELHTWINECNFYPDGETPDFPYTSVRWRESHTIDSNGYTTRNIAGQVRFVASLVDGMTVSNGQPTADAYRGLIAPPNIQLLSYFKRESVKMIKTEDGLGLHFDITDREVYNLPVQTSADPTNIVTKMVGSYTTYCTSLTFTKIVVQLQAWGTPTTSKTCLIDALLSAVLQRLDLNALDATKVAMTGIIKDEVGEENSVSLQLSIVCSVKIAASFAGLQTDNPQANGVMNYWGNGVRVAEPPNVGLRGSAGLHMLIFDQYLSMCKNAPQPGQDHPEEGLGGGGDPPADDGGGGGDF